MQRYYIIPWRYYNSLILKADNSPSCGVMNVIEAEGPLPTAVTAATVTV